MNKKYIGIVVEFNPLHNGHKRLIDTVKEENPDCILIAAMSGQFVQRGELSIFDKWTRAEAAVNLGVDLVVEIPPLYVLNNANIFANKAMEIFNEYNVTDVYFGSEDLDINELTNISNILINKEDELNKLKNEYHSLPKAFEALLDTKLNPNDTLGICYIAESIKSNYNFEFHRIKRESNQQWSSASRIRKDLWNNIENDKSLIKDAKIRSLDDYSQIILGKIITTDSEIEVIKYLKNILDKKSYDKFSTLVEDSHNKNFTKARIRRDVMKFILELEGTSELLILASSDLGKDILRDSDTYNFRHTKSNTDNYKVERFINILSDSTLEIELAKRTIFKEK